MPVMPLVTALRNPGMRERHWDALTNDLKFELRPDDRFTLRHATESLRLHETKLLEKVQAKRDAEKAEHLAALAEAQKGQKVARALPARSLAPCSLLLARGPHREPPREPHRDAPPRQILHALMGRCRNAEVSHVVLHKCSGHEVAPPTLTLTPNPNPNPNPNPKP